MADAVTSTDSLLVTLWNTRKHVLYRHASIQYTGTAVLSSCKYILLLFILTANGFLPGGSGTTVRHDTQITHFAQNNTMIKRNRAHKTIFR